MRDRLDEMRDAAVVLITFTRARNLRGYRSRLRLPYRVVTDETLEAYRAYGLGRGPWWRVWGLRTLREYRRLLRGGVRLERTLEDTLQLGGDFVVDRHGRLAYAYRSTGPSDRPSVDELVSATAPS